MSRFTLVGLVYVLATGCTAQQGGNGGADGNTNHGDVTPKVGVWHYAEVTPVTNTCNSNVNHGETGDFAIDAASLTSIHINPNDGTAAFTCSLSGGAFDCPDRAAFVQDYHPSVDAIVTIHATADGTFSDPTHGSGTQHATVSCTGTQCGLAGPFPCTFSQHFAIVAL